MKFINSSTDSRINGSTKYNENSSRSHAIFQIKIKKINKLNVEIESIINIVDLAGSERSLLENYHELKKNDFENEKKLQKEANFINKSLTTLGRIINIISDKKSNHNHIPYRDSKLTLVLQVNIYLIFRIF